MNVERLGSGCFGYLAGVFPSCTAQAEFPVRGEQPSKLSEALARQLSEGVLYLDSGLWGVQVELKP